MKKPLIASNQNFTIKHWVQKATWEWLLKNLFFIPRKLDKKYFSVFCCYWKFRSIVLFSYFQFHFYDCINLFNAIIWKDVAIILRWNKKLIYRFMLWCFIMHNKNTSTVCVESSTLKSIGRKNFKFQSSCHGLKWLYIIVLR
jgi:hypothetical protein